LLFIQVGRGRNGRCTIIDRSSYETYHNQYAWQQAQQLTWEDNYNKQDVSFVTIDKIFGVGTRMLVLRGR